MSTSAEPPSPGASPVTGETAGGKTATENTEPYELFLVSFDGKRKCRVSEGQTIAQHLNDPAHTSWLHILAHDVEATMKYLVDDLKFHPIAAEDALTDDERPELKEFGDSLFFVIPAVVVGDRPWNFEIREVAFFLREHSFVTVVREQVPAIATWHDRLVGRQEVREPRAAFLMHAVLDTLIDDYFPSMDRIEEAVDQISDSFYEGNIDRDERRSLKRMLRLKQNNLRLRRSIAPVREVTNGLMRRDQEYIPDDLRPYIQDVYSNTLRILESLDLSRDALSNLFEVRLSVTNNKLSEVVERMTAISTALVISTLIAGIYGMNFEHMPELKWIYGYPFALGLMVVLSGGTLLLFKRLRWF